MNYLSSTDYNKRDVCIAIAEEGKKLRERYGDKRLSQIYLIPDEQDKASWLSPIQLRLIRRIDEVYASSLDPVRAFAADLGMGKGALMRHINIGSWKLTVDKAAELLEIPEKERGYYFENI